MNQKYIRYLGYGLMIALSHDLMIAQETSPQKTPADPKQKEAILFYWKSEVTDLMEQKKALDAKYTELQTKYTKDTEALKAENERLKKLNAELEADKQNRVASRDTQTQNADQRIASLQQELAETKRQKEQLERDLAAKTFAEQQAQERIKTLERSIAAANAEKNATVASNQNNSDLQAQVNSLTAQRDQLQKDLAANNAYIDSLKKNQNTTTTTTTSTSTSSQGYVINSVTPSGASTESLLLDSQAQVKSLEARLIDVIQERDRLQKDLADAKAGQLQAVRPETPATVPSNYAPAAPKETTKTTVTTSTESSTTTTTSASKSAAAAAATTTPTLAPVASTTDQDKRIADLQAQVNSLTNQRDQLQRDIAAIYGYQTPTVGQPANPTTVIENNSKTAAGTTANTTTSTSTPTVISSNQSLDDAMARNKKLEADLAEMTKQRDKLQKELDTNYNNMYNSKTNPLSPANPQTKETTTTTTTTTETSTSTAKSAAGSEAKLADSKDAKSVDAKSADAKTADAKVADAKSSSTTTTTTTTETTSTTGITRIAQLENEVAALTKERDQLKRDLQASKADKTIETRLAEVNSRIEKIQADKTLTEAEKAEKLKAANAEIEKINQEKNANTTSIASNNKELEKKNAAMEDMKKEYESKIEALNKEIAELKEDKETLESDLATSKEQLEEEGSKHKEEIERLTEQAQKLEEALEKEIKKGNKSKSNSGSNTTPASAQVSSKGGKTIISLASSVNFHTGSRELTPEGKRTLDNIIKVLKKHSTEKILVEGNTDNRPVPTNSKMRDNWHLSFERALTVLKYLKKGQLQKTQFLAGGFADSNPVKPNTSESNRAANRRVDIIVLPKR